MTNPKMKAKNLDKVYILNPHYHLRHDIHRVVLFSRGGTDAVCSRNWHTFIHPLQAAMLSFFTYNRPMKETIPLLCDYFCKDRNTIEGWVREFINNPAPVFTPLQHGKIYFPKRILIEAEKAEGEPRFMELDAGSFIWKKLDLTTRRLYTGPMIVTLMLTNRCITRCKYCYADTTTAVHAPLSTERLFALIHEAARMQVQQVNLMGGEIFLHKDWQPILKELVKLDIAPDFLSTKIPMTEERIKAVKETGYQGVIQVSLDACDSEVLQPSIGVGADYATNMLKGLRLLDESGLKYQISSVLTTYNCRIDILSRMLHELSSLKRPADWRIVPVSNSIMKNYEKEFSYLKPTKEQLATVFGQMRTLIGEGVGFPVVLGEEAIHKPFGYAQGEVAVSKVVNARL